MKAKGGQKNMDAKEVTRPKAAVPLLSFLILCVLLSTTPLAAELYTRTDELSCGDAKVQAVTTCITEPNPHFPECTEQHFLFSNPKAGISVRIRASGEPADERTAGMTILGGLAGDWACVKGKAGLYVVIGYWTGGICEWDEVFDLKGRRVLAEKGDCRPTDRETIRFNKKWDSLGLPNPWPWNSFTNIRVLKTDK